MFVLGAVHRRIPRRLGKPFLQGRRLTLRSGCRLTSAALEKVRLLLSPFVVVITLSTHCACLVRLPYRTVVLIVILVVPFATSSLEHTPSTLVAELLEQSYSS